MGKLFQEHIAIKFQRILFVIVNTGEIWTQMHIFGFEWNALDAMRGVVQIFNFTHLHKWRALKYMRHTAKATRTEAPQLSRPFADALKVL